MNSISMPVGEMITGFISMPLKTAILHIRDTIRLGANAGYDFTCRIEIDGKNQILYVVTKENNTLYVINLISKSIENKLH